ncbi:hypothetical protein ANCDUO_19059, partial [Ancylostoma duodenale]
MRVIQLPLERQLYVEFCEFVFDKIVKIDGKYGSKNRRSKERRMKQLRFGGFRPTRRSRGGRDELCQDMFAAGTHSSPTYPNLTSLTSPNVWMGWGDGLSKCQPCVDCRDYERYVIMRRPQ